MTEAYNVQQTHFEDYQIEQALAILWRGANERSALSNGVIHRINTARTQFQEVGFSPGDFSGATVEGAKLFRDPLHAYGDGAAIGASSLISFLQKYLPVLSIGMFLPIAPRETYDGQFTPVVFSGIENFGFPTLWTSFPDGNTVDRLGAIRHFLRVQAGLPGGCFRRKQSFDGDFLEPDPWSSGIDDYDIFDPPPQSDLGRGGYARTGDVLGPWIIEDLIKYFRALTWFQSPIDGQFLPMGFDVAAQLTEYKGRGTGSSRSEAIDDCADDWSLLGSGESMHRVPLVIGSSGYNVSGSEHRVAQDVNYITAKRPGENSIRAYLGYDSSRKVVEFFELFGIAGQLFRNLNSSELPVVDQVHFERLDSHAADFNLSASDFFDAGVWPTPPTDFASSLVPSSTGENVRYGGIIIVQKMHFADSHLLLDGES